MTLATDTARARAKCIKMLTAHERRRNDADPVPEPPFILLPPTRTDITYILDVLNQLEQANIRMAHEARLVVAEFNKTTT